MLERDKCYLRPLAESDLELVFKWRNSERIRNVMFTDHPISWEEHVAWYRRVQEGRTNSLVFVFAYDKNIIGQVNITQIDLVNQHCYWGFYIGSEDAPLGSGMAMGFTALEYIFETMDMHKLCSEVFAFNFASINYHKKLGFVEEGYFKEHMLKTGKLEDMVCFAHFSYLWHQQKTMLLQRYFEVNYNNAANQHK